jgi:hypothetical protein
MHVLAERDAAAVRERLAGLAGPVRLEYVTEGSSGIVIPGRECRSCGETQRLLEDLAACSPLLSLTVHDRSRDPEASAAFGIDKVPGLALVGAGDYGIRYYGMPVGYELRNLLDLIVDVGRGTADLAAETQHELAGLAADVRLQVLVTPT